MRSMQAPAFALFESLQRSETRKLESGYALDSILNQSRKSDQSFSAVAFDMHLPRGGRRFNRPDQSTLDGFRTLAGASVAKAVPLRVMATSSPHSIHFATLAKWFRKSRTVAVFMMIQICITPRAVSTAFHPLDFVLQRAAADS